MSRRGSVIVPAAGPPSLAGKRRKPGHRLLRGLSIAATATTFLLIAIGGLVRATGSGLGCPGWPRCFGRWIPPFEYHAIIEYSHRLTAALDIVLIALLAAHAWRAYREVPRVFRPAAGAVGLVLAQAALGGVVVRGNLEAFLVTAHFATAMVLAAVLVTTTVASFSLDVRPAGPLSGVARLSFWTAGAVFVLLLVGAYVRGEGAGLAFRDWPLMGGRLLPALDTEPQVLQLTHRALALMVGVLIASLVVRTLGDGVRRPVVVLAVTAGLLYVVQVLVGAANVWSGLAPAAVVAHVVVGSLVWGTLVASVATARACSSVGRDKRND